MNWFSHTCTCHRPSLCLLASGVLPASERGTLERHLAACPDCRDYFAEIQAVTASLEQLNSGARSLPVRLPARQMTPHFETTGRDARATTWWQEVIWPHRRIWTGLAAAWVMILAGNLLLRDPASPALAAQTSASSQTMLMAFRDRQNTLTELLADHSAPAEAERRKTWLPRPRSEKAIRLA